MNTTDAMLLTSGTEVMVRRASRSRSREAVVIDSPRQVGDSVLVPISYLKERSTQTYSQRYNVAIIPSDEVRVR